MLPSIVWRASLRRCPNFANSRPAPRALPSIVKLPGLQIDTVYLLSDRDKNEGQFQKIFRSVREEEDRGRYRVVRLEKDRQIWGNSRGTLKLTVVHPTFSENVEATKPNQTSAILWLLQNDEVVIIWPGDAPMQKVAKLCGGLTPAIMSGPHHGGPTDRKHADFKKWVHSLSPERMYVSVGTKQNYGLPAPEYISERVAAGCHVICSQLTKLCDNEHVNKGIPVLQTAALLGLRPPRTGVPCRGCYRSTITETNILPDAFDIAHRDRINLLRRPKCIQKP
jgi:hypothetical protein